ncbi:hypothetical protein HDU76_010260 [Blyttiomyces sp. JEL0837]|nr:hypothetical protein HDU76_010260 [Blyttiomyces sp. JEL0837]
MVGVHSTHKALVALFLLHAISFAFLGGIATSHASPVKAGARPPQALRRQIDRDIIINNTDISKDQYVELDRRTVGNDIFHCSILSGATLTGTIPDSLGSVQPQGYKRYANAFGRRSNYTPLPNLANLNTLDLSNNSITGGIPTTLGNLAALTSLSLGSNNISGEIPVEIAHLKNLEILDLGSNNISGQIPPVIGTLKNLANLDLSGNNINGSIPSSLGNLRNLTALNLGSNMLGGTIPTSLGNLQKLTTLVLSVNQFSGPLPPALKSLNITTFVVNNGCVTAVPATTTAKPTISSTPKTVECFPKSMSKYVTKPTALPTLNIYGIQGDARNATYVAPVPTTNENTASVYQPTPVVSDKCFDYSINGPFIPSTGPNLYGPNGDAEGAPCDTEGQVNNLHCAGSCIAQCAQNKWTYLTCPNGLICRPDLGAPVCGFPYDHIPPPASPTPVMTYNLPTPTATYAVQDQSGVCFPTNIPGYTATYNPLPVPNIYGTQGDALDAPCDTEGQVNNTHCVGACVAQCAQGNWTYLSCPSGLVCRKDMGGPVCGFPQLGR